MKKGPKNVDTARCGWSFKHLDTEQSRLNASTVDPSDKKRFDAATRNGKTNEKSGKVHLLRHIYSGCGALASQYSSVRHKESSF